MKRATRQRRQKPRWYRSAWILGGLAMIGIIIGGAMMYASPGDESSTTTSLNSLPPPTDWKEKDIAGVLVELDRIGEKHDKDKGDASPSMISVMKQWVPLVNEYFARHGLAARNTISDKSLATVDGMLYVAYLSSVYPSLAMALHDEEGHRNALTTADVCLRSLLRLTRTSGAEIDAAWKSTDANVGAMMNRVAPQRRDWGRLRDRLALRRAAVLEELMSLERSMLPNVHPVYLYTFIIVLRGCDRGMREDYASAVPRGTAEKTRLVEELMLRWCRSPKSDRTLWKAVADMLQSQNEILRKDEQKWVVPGIAPFELDEIVGTTRPLQM